MPFSEQKPQLVLASQSPRRAELLRQLGLHFVVRPVDIDEAVKPAEKASDYVQRLALEKAQIGWQHNHALGLPVLGSDTTVVIDGDILGKPQNKMSALAMWRRLSGQTHRVLSAVACVSAGQQQVICSQTLVEFAELSSAQCERYWATGEPQDKAGGYGIQGLGGRFVKRIQGSYTGVVGLPLFETAELLNEFGVETL